MSGFVPGVENDLFISYSHAEDPTWIQAFEKSLREELSSRLGFGASVWQDTKRLRVGQSWHDEIEKGVKQSAIFIAVLSPSYRASDWCRRERAHFQQLFDSHDAFLCSNRFFKVVKLPWEEDGHQYFLPSIQHLEFFRPEGSPAGDAEFVPGSGEFRNAVRGLATTLTHTLRELRRKRERIFVGSPADDCFEVWHQLRQELHDQGYEVKPDGPLGPEFDDHLIRRDLEGALLSVHLLGATYDSSVERQIGLSADLERRLMFWLAPGAYDDKQDPRQAWLIQALSNGLRPDHPTEKLRPPDWLLLKDLASHKLIEGVLAALKPQQAASATPSAEDDVSRIYLVHDATTEEDSRIASELGEQIVAREGLRVFLPQRDPSSGAAQRQRHETLMQTCEGVLLYRSAAPEEWFLQMTHDVIFAEKQFKRGPFKSQAFLVPDPSRWAVLQNLQAIEYRPSLSLADLEPFLAPLRAQGGAACGG